MSITEKHYFALMRSALWGSPVAIDEAIDWKAVLQLAQYHATNTLVSGTASLMTGDNKPSDEVLAKMKNAMRSNLVSQLNLKQILLSSVKALRDFGVEPVLLKGFALAMLYPNPNLRQFGDVDLYVGLDNFHQACEAVRKGLPNAYNWGGEVDSGKHYNLEFGNYALEVHRISADVIDPKENAAYAAIELEGLKQHAQKVDFEGFPLTIPSKEFMVFFTFYHAWHHFLTTGVGWKQIADVAITLHAYRGQLDHDTLRRYFTDMHVLKPWQAFGYLMVHYLGLPEEEMPFYNPSVASTAQRLYARIMEEGNFKRDRSFKRRRPKRRLGQKMHAFVGIFVDFFHLAKVFPASAWREMRNSLGHAFAKNLPHGEKNGH